MNEGEIPKKYDTNPLDKRVAERAEAEMGDEDPETEAPTRAMPLMEVPDAGGETRQMGRDTASQSQSPTAAAGTPSTAPTRGMYAPPPSAPAPYAEPQNYPSSPVYDYPSQSFPPAAYTPAGPPATNPYGHSPLPQRAGGSEALGLKPNFAAMLGYLPLIGIAAAFLFVILEPARNRFVRFHAKQALLAHLAFWVVLAAFNIARGIAPGFLGLLLILPQMVFFVGSMVGFIMMMVKALAGERAKIPILGDQAE
jgi:uncharacterized membrane protein